MIENHRVANPPSAQLIAALEKALEIRSGALRKAADWANTPDPVRKELARLTQSAAKTRQLAEWLKEATATEGEASGGKPGEESGKRPGKKAGGRDLDVLFHRGELRQRIEEALVAADAPTGEPRMLSRDSTQRVPLINRVAAGYPKDFTDLDYPARVADEYVACPHLDDPDAFAARVVGDSMIPDYNEGDIVVFSPRAEIKDGADCFVRLEPDHHTTFKRVFFEADQGQRKGSRIRLQPLNARYAPTTLPREQVSGLWRAVWRMQAL